MIDTTKNENIFCKFYNSTVETEDSWINDESNNFNII